MPHDIRAKLSALHDDLARESKPTLSIISTDGLSAKREMGDMDRGLRELQTQLADAATTPASCSKRIIF